MNKYLFTAGVSALFCLVAGCQPKGNIAQAENAINARAIKSHIAVLADDSMEGRKPFSAGEEKTIHYISRQFQKTGLEPGNHGSYFQQVPMVEIASIPTGPMHIAGGKTDLSLSEGTDFVAMSEHEQDTVQLKNSPLVFAGFGIVAPEYHWNDYAGLDVKGKTVVVLVNDPGFQSGDARFFKGDTMTYYGRWTYKYEEAARQGAAGVLIIHQTKPASYPWSVVQSSFTGAHLYLKDTAGHRDRCKMEGWITYDAAKRLLFSAGITGDFTAMARRRGFKAVPLNKSISIGFINHIRYNASHNVIAVLPGTRTPAQYIIYTAHWDHFGTGIPVNGDSLYNGAVDNASGVAALLAMAKAYTMLREKPERSIVFLAVTAEEQGLLGSKYYAEHPVYPLNRTVADLNMDALGNYGKTDDIVITGLGQSHLEDYVSEIAASEGKTVRGDLNPASGSYFRSDHFSFAKVGVPSLDINNGLESVDHDRAWTDSIRRDFGQNHYHQPSDEYSPAMNADGMVEIARILFEAGCKLGSEDTFPGWKPGSAFKEKRAAMMLK